MLRRSQSITLTIVGAIALAACDDQDNISADSEVKHCVDENGVVQDESNCATAPADFDGGTIDPQQPIHYGTTHFFWYYGGSRIYAPGYRIIGSGGSYHPSFGHSYSAPSTISRGGFGATGHSFGGGGGE